MSNITDITKIDGGWQYTLDTAPACGWDIWLDGTRLVSRVTDTTYKLFVSDSRPPAIEVIDPSTDTPSHSAAGTIRVSWQHTGAWFYIIEYSPDDTDYYQIDVVPGDGDVWHRFVITAQDSTGYFRIYPASLDDTGYYKTGFSVPCIVEQAFLPKAPIVLCSVEDGLLHIELIRYGTGGINSLVTATGAGDSSLNKDASVYIPTDVVSYGTSGESVEGELV